MSDYGEEMLANEIQSFNMSDPFDDDLGFVSLKKSEMSTPNGISQNSSFQEYNNACAQANDFENITIS